MKKHPKLKNSLKSFYEVYYLLHKCKMLQTVTKVFDFNVFSLL